MGIAIEDFLKSHQAYRARLSHDDNAGSQTSSEDFTTRPQVSHVSIMSDGITGYEVSSDVPEHSGGVITHESKPCIEWIVNSHTHGFSIAGSAQGKAGESREFLIRSC